MAALTCPSCGRTIDDPDGVCAVCGFTVGRAAGAWAGDVADGPVDGAADAAVDDGADAAVDAGDGAPTERAPGWVPSPPALVSAPTPVTPPPSQISVDGLEMHWSARPLRRPVLAAAAAASAVATATVAEIPSGPRSAGAAAAAGRGSSAPAPRASFAPTPSASSRPFALPRLIERAAARARERQRELYEASPTRAAAVTPARQPGARAASMAIPGTSAGGMPAAPTPTTLGPDGFGQVLSSDFLSDSTISSTGQRAAPAAGAQTVGAAPPRVLVYRATPAPAPATPPGAAYPSWWRETAATGTSAPAWPVPGRPRSSRRRGRSLLPLIPFVFVGLALLVNHLSSASFQPASGGSGGGVSPTISIVTPEPSDLAAVRAQLHELAGIVTPAGPLVQARPAAAAKARRLRVRLVRWRDSFALPAHRIDSLDKAVAYAGALGRWLRAPQDAARRAAALSAWRAWRADDPLLKHK